MKDYATELGVPDERIAAAGMPRSEVNKFIADHLEWREERGNEDTTLHINNQPILPPTAWTARDEKAVKKRGKKSDDTEETDGAEE